MGQHRVDREPSETGNIIDALGDHHAADQQRDAEPDDRDDGNRGVPERVPDQDDALGQSLGARGADVVLGEHLDDAGAGHAGDQRDIDHGERQARQHEVDGPIGDIFADAPVALHRQPIELDRENVDQQIADDEHRDREAEHGKTHQAAVEQAAGALGGEHAERHRDQHREHDGDDGKRERRLDALGDQLGYRLLEEEALAEIALQAAPGPDEELLENRPVEPELAADLGDLLGGGGIPGDDGGRIAGGEAEHQEHDDRDRRQHRHGGEQSMGDEGEHEPRPGAPRISAWSRSRTAAPEPQASRRPCPCDRRAVPAWPRARVRR